GDRARWQGRPREPGTGLGRRSASGGSAVDRARAVRGGARPAPRPGRPAEPRRGGPAGCRAARDRGRVTCAQGDPRPRGGSRRRTPAASRGALGRDIAATATLRQARGVPDLTWADLTWAGLTRAGLTWAGLARAGLTWAGLTRAGHTRGRAHLPAGHRSDPAAPPRCTDRGESRFRCDP